MKIQIGTMVTGDFGDNTMTFEIEGKMILAAGKYAIMPIKEYESEFNNVDLADVNKCDHNYIPCEHEAVWEFDKCTKCGKIK